MTDLVEEIRKGYARGWSFTPLNGKVPWLPAWQKRRRPSLEECIVVWAHQGNVGLRTGAASGVAVIDIEAEAAHRWTEFPRTVTAFTGGGGYHLYYRASQPVKCSVGMIGDCHHCGSPKQLKQCPKQQEPNRCTSYIDVRGDGGQVVFVGSTHPETGQQYRWMALQSPEQCEMAEFPYHLLPQPKQRSSPQPPRQAGPVAGTHYARVALTNACNRVAATLEGSRHNTLLNQASDIGSMVWAGWLDRDDATRELAMAGKAAGLDDHDAERTAADGIAWGAEHPTDYVRAKAQQERQPPPPEPEPVLMLDEIDSY